MENRLCLNNKPDYSCDLFRVEECLRSINRYKIPDDKPDIRICAYGYPVGEVLETKEKSSEMWVYCQNKDDVKALKDFLINKDGLNDIFAGKPTGVPSVRKGRVEKAIKEEFYGK